MKLKAHIHMYIPNVLVTLSESVCLLVIMNSSRYEQEQWQD